MPKSYPAPAAIEALESRRLLSVSMSADGWTQVAPAKDTRIFYVSNSGGNDANDGLSPGHPVQSLARGIGMLRDRSADWLLLKAGDSWHQSLDVWRKSGRSNGEPLLVSSYGVGPRPLLYTGTDPGLAATSISGQQVDHLAIVGLHFYANGRDPAATATYVPRDVTGINILTKTDGLTIEDCQVEGYAVNINVQSFYGPISNVSIRRNVIDDAYATTTHSQGLYCYGVTNLDIEGNLFDRNGFNDAVPGAQATYYNHDCYLSSNNVNCVVRDNVFARAAGYGLQARSGGDVEDNVFLNDPVGMSYGLVNGAHTTPGGVSGVVNGNVFLGGANIGAVQGGTGLVLGNTKPGYPTVVSNNIFAHGVDRAPGAIQLTFGLGQSNPSDSVGLNDLDIENNIISDYYRGLYVDSGFTPGGAGLTALNDVNVRQNDFQNVPGTALQQLGPVDPSQEHWADNRYFNTPDLMLVNQKKMTRKQWDGANEKGGTYAEAAYADSARGISSYDSAIGGPGTLDHFLAWARQQSRQTWSVSYTSASIVNYMRVGYQETTAPPRNWLPPTPPIVSDVAMPPGVMDKAGAVTFSVTYLDDKAVNTATIASGNLTAIAKGYSAPAQLVSMSGDGAQLTATYSVAAPGGAFRKGHAFNFTLMLGDRQVYDNEGFPAMAAPEGKFKVKVAARPKPPTVMSVKLMPGGQAVAVRFNGNVGASLSASDLILTGEQGQTIDPATMVVIWDALHSTAVWTFPGQPDGRLPVGRWTVRITAATLVDPLGQALDGNHDGRGGDDFLFKAPLVSTALPAPKV